LYPGPFPSFLWTLAGFDSSGLIQDYISGILLEPRLSPVFEAPHGVMSCGLVGIDLLPSRGSLYFPESNFTPGHSPQRDRISPADDTVCNYLAAWASGQGFTKLVFFSYNYPAVFEQSMEEAWQTVGKRNGIRIEIVDDPAFASPWRRSRRVLMDPHARGTLYVNGRHLPGPLPRLVSRKGLMEAAIRRFWGPSITTGCLALPGLVRRDADLRPLDEQSPFPNLIIKRADLD